MQMAVDLPAKAVGKLSRVVDLPVMVGRRSPVLALDVEFVHEGRASPKERDQAIVTAGAPAPLRAAED